MVLEARKKKKEQEVQKTKHKNLEENVAKQKVGSFKNMNSLARGIIFHLCYLPLGVCMKNQLLGSFILKNYNSFSKFIAAPDLM